MRRLILAALAALGVTAASADSFQSVPLGLWTTYTPTIAASTPGGTPPTFGTVLGRYQVTGKRVDFSITAPLTTIGTASGNIQLSGPPSLPAQLGTAPIFGINATTFDGMTAGMSSSTITVIKTSGNAFPYTGSSQTLIISGSYETQ